MFRFDGTNSLLCSWFQRFEMVEGQIYPRKSLLIVPRIQLEANVSQICMMKEDGLDQKKKGC